MDSKISIDRRKFISQTTLITVAASCSSALAQSSDVPAMPFPKALARICVFEKLLQDLSYDQLAETVAELGFAGIEATVRKKGHVQPERVEDDLPKLVESLKKCGLEVTIMATDVRSPAQPLTEKVLRTAASLGIKTYRMGYYRYNLSKPIVPQLDEIRPKMQELAALNRELKIGAIYQNHCSPRNVGATLWDLYSLIKDISPDEIGSAFDIRHAVVEAGLSWPVLYDVLKSHIRAVYVKDFQWVGRQAKHVPLGNGRVGPDFFSMLKRDNFQGPISLHIEYLSKVGTPAKIHALRRDLSVLKKWLHTAS